jgi:hypothetical protein
MADGKPGEGLWGWLGRQVGHVKKAVKTDVTKGVQPQAPAQQQGETAAASEGAKPQAAAPPEKEVVYREEKAEEVELPDQPGVVLRRTVIDEVIVDPEKTGQSEEESKG